MKRSRIFPFGFYFFPGLSRVRIVTSFAVAVLPRDAISFSFRENCGRKIPSEQSRESNLASSTNNLQKFPITSWPRYIHGICSIKWEERYYRIGASRLGSRFNFVKCYCSPLTLKFLSWNRNRVEKYRAKILRKRANALVVFRFFMKLDVLSSSLILKAPCD